MKPRAIPDVPVWILPHTVHASYLPIHEGEVVLMPVKVIRPGLRFLIPSPTCFPFDAIGARLCLSAYLPAHGVCGR